MDDNEVPKDVTFAQLGRIRNKEDFDSGFVNEETFLEMEKILDRIENTSLGDKVERILNGKQ